MSYCEKQPAERSAPQRPGKRRGRGSARTRGAAGTGRAAHPAPPPPAPGAGRSAPGAAPRCTSGGPGRLPAGGGVLRLAVVPGAARRGLPSSASAGLLSAAQRYGKKIDLCENFEVVQGEGF